MADTIQSLISGILDSKLIIVDKVSAMGKCTSTATLAQAAEGLDSVTIHTTTSKDVTHGGTDLYLPAGYYPNNVTLNGTNGPADAGTMIPNLSSLSVTPTTSKQEIKAAEHTNDSGTITGYNIVTVEAIPTNYVDKNSSTYATVDATAADVLSGKKFINKDFNVDAGTMPNNGTIITQTLSGSKTSYTIPKGYHSGSGKVQISTQTKTDTVTTGSVTVNADSGKVLTSVTVTGPTASTTTTDQIIDGLDTTSYVKTVNSGYLASNRTVTFDPTSVINALKAI